MKHKFFIFVFLSLFLVSCSSKKELHETILKIKNNYSGENLSKDAQYFNYDIDLNILDKTNNKSIVISIRNKIYSIVNFKENRFYPNYYFQEVNKYYFVDLNNETLGWFNVRDILSVFRAVNLMNENCKFNFFDKFEAVTKTSYSLELDDTYYKFFDADLFTYTREITIGHHSNLVDFIQVFN